MKKFPKIGKKSEKFGTKLVNSLKIVGKGWAKIWTESTTKSRGCWAGTSFCPGRVFGAVGGPPGAVSGSKGGPQGPNPTPGGVPCPIAWLSPTSPGMPRPCPWHATPCLCLAMSWACLALPLPLACHAMPCFGLALPWPDLILGVPRLGLALPLPCHALSLPCHALSGPCHVRHVLDCRPNLPSPSPPKVRSSPSSPSSPPPRPCALCPVKDYNAREGGTGVGRAVTHHRSSCSGLGQGTVSITIPIKSLKRFGGCAPSAHQPCITFILQPANLCSP